MISTRERLCNMALLSRRQIPRILKMDLKSQSQSEQKEQPSMFGVHQANMHLENASFRQRKQLIRAVAQMNPVSQPSAFAMGDVNRSSQVLEPSKIVWTLHNIKRSVHNIIYYGDLSVQGQQNLRQQNQKLIKSVYDFQKLYKEIVLAEHDKIVQEVN